MQNAAAQVSEVIKGNEAIQFEQPTVSWTTKADEATQFGDIATMLEYRIGKTPQPKTRCHYPRL